MRPLLPFTLAAVGLALFAASCGGGQRNAVAHYIDRVNVIEMSLASPLGTVTRAGNGLGGAGSLLSPADERRQMSLAEQQIDSLAQQLAAIDAPPAAQHLRALVVQLVRQQKALAHEVAALVEFLPRYRAVLASLAPARQRLQRQLLVAKKMAAASNKNGAKAMQAAKDAALAVQGSALGRYDSDLGRIIRQLRALHPPAVAVAAYRTQLTTLEGVAEQAVAFERAVEQKRLGDIPAIAHDLQVASVSNQSVAAQKAQILAISVYDRRVQHLDSLAASIQEEQNRLENALH